MGTKRGRQLHTYVQKDLFLRDIQQQQLVQVPEPGPMCYHWKPATQVMEHSCLSLTDALLYQIKNYNI